MVENNDLKSESTMSSANVKLITDNKKILEETTRSIQQEIKTSFDHLINLLRSREKQLLRQVEAVHIQQLSLIQSNLDVVSCKPLINIDLSLRHDLESRISCLGKLEVFGKNGISVKDTEPYKVQEYQDADKDHESFNKSIKYGDKESQIVKKSIDFQDTSEINISGSDENAPLSNDSNLSCSYGSSFDSSVESENRSNQEIGLNSNCTIIHKQIPALDNESLAEVESVKPNDMSLELLSENSKIVTLKDKEISVDSEESYSNNAICKEMTNLNFSKDINANKERDSLKQLSSSNTVYKSGQIRRDSGEHPKQIQQWLQQILVETETEPMIHEIEQFSEISKARLSGQFPLET